MVHKPEVVLPVTRVCIYHHLIKEHLVTIDPSYQLDMHLAPSELTLLELIEWEGVKELLCDKHSAHVVRDFL